MIVDENIVYFYCKRLLRKAGVHVFAGEPPGGSDELHRVELKHPKFKDKGSKGSRKFDLIAYHKSRFLLIELKDSSSKHEKDILKLQDTIEDDEWLISMWNNMNERQLFGKGKIPIYTKTDFLNDRDFLFQLCLGAGPSDYIPPDNFIYFEVNKNYIKCRGNNLKYPEVLTDLIDKTKEYN